ncbi:MAG: hypothetical protein KIG95_10255 [Comamonas sp.]|nr:hypothetical protein [Comamonas sp.]
MQVSTPHPTGAALRSARFAVRSVSWVRYFAAPLLASSLLTGCLDKVPGIAPPPKVLAKQKEDRAIGSACRYAGRSIEDCYVLNPKASKNQMFDGWKEMDGYMREHNIEGVPSVIAPNTPPKPRPPVEDDLLPDSNTANTARPMLR